MALLNRLLVGRFFPRFKKKKKLFSFSSFFFVSMRRVEAYWSEMFVIATIMIQPDNRNFG